MFMRRYDEALNNEKRQLLTSTKKDSLLFSLRKKSLSEKKRGIDRT
jgi:hypothetical protein